MVSIRIYWTDICARDSGNRETSADSILKRSFYSAMENINSTMILYRHSTKNNRVAIDVFFAGRVGR